MREYNWLRSVEKYLENFEGNEVIVIGDDLLTVEIYYTIQSLQKYKIPYVVSNNKNLFFEKDIIIKTENEFIETQVNSKEQFFYVARLTSHKESYDLLHYKGLIVNRDFVIMGIGGYTKPIDAIDSLLGFSRLNEKVPGFTVFGDAETSDTSIVVLGNSTSDPSTGMLKCWSRMLYETLCGMGLKVVLYNGATTGYCSTQEFLKFNRDVLGLSPDLVISMGGYNDIEGTSSVEGYPFLHKYSKKFYDFLYTNPRMAPDSMYIRNVNQVSHGSKSFSDDSDIWVNNMKKIKAICDINNIDFIAFFQPILLTETTQIDDAVGRIIEEFYDVSGVSEDDLKNKTFIYSEKIRRKILDYDFIIDLTNLFFNKSNVFYDTCHYTEKGNRIISNRVLAEIIPILKGRGVEYEKID